MAKRVRATLNVEIELYIHDHIDLDWFCEHGYLCVLDLPEYPRDISQRIGTVASIATGVESMDLIGVDWPSQELPILRREAPWKRVIRRIKRLVVVGR